MSDADGRARGLWHCSADIRSTTTTTTTKPFSLIGSKQPWLKQQTWWNISEKNSFKLLVEVFFRYNLSLTGGQLWLKGRWLTDGRPGSAACVFCCRSRGWFKKESSQVFTFNMIGASCATLHSNQETLWHFNSQGNEWKSTPVKLFLLLFISDDIKPIQSTVKLIECVTLCYSCPIKAKWIHKALLQQIRVISFFYLTYVMTHKIKRKYIYVFQLLSPFFTLYKIFCVCVCACYELSMSINIVQCSLHKQRPTDSSQELTKVSPLNQTFTTCNTKGFDPTGDCHMVLITSHYPRNNPRVKMASVFRHNIVHVIIVNNRHQTRLPRPDRFHWFELSLLDQSEQESHQFLL